MNKAVMETEQQTSRVRQFAVPNDTPHAPYVELKDSLESNLAALTPFLSRLMRLIATFTPDKSAVADIEVSMREALLNAVIHGNQNDPHKRVYVTCRCEMLGDTSLAVRDEGTGFAHGTVEGRGICLMRALMDEVSFGDGGSVVYLKKRASEIASAARVH